MKNLFVPIDFSPSSLNALDFALSIALKLKAKLTLFHAFQVPTPAIEIPYDVMEAKEKSKREEVQKKLIAECNKIQKSGKIPFGEIDFEYVAIEGTMPDALVDHVLENNVDLTVMGTNVMGHHTSGIFGSTASDLMLQVQCPVIILPEHTHVTRDLKKITFATNYHTTDVDAIVKLSALAEAFNAQLNVMHVFDERISKEEQVRTMNYFRKVVSAETDYANISFQIMEGKNAEEKLKDYIVAGEDADLIVLSTHLRNWIERLFDKSFTKRMALKAKVPMLIMHHEEQDILREE